MSVFSRNKINTGRQAEIDLARGFTALLIIICHVGLYIGGTSNQLLFSFSDIIGSEPGAPVFMALMGISIVFNKSTTPKTMFIRGITLFIEGYLLSFYRTILLGFIFGNIDEWTTLESFFVVDIFQFAGLSLILIALLRKIKMPSYGIFILSILMVFVDQILIANPLNIQNKYLVFFLSLFTPLFSWSCFPLLTWFFFPAFGLVYGEILLRCKDKKRFYEVLLPVSLLGVIYIYSNLYHLYPTYAERYYFGGNFYYMGVREVLLTVSVICFSLSFWYFANDIFSKSIKKHLTILGKNLTPFYAISWIFIAILIHFNAKYSITVRPSITILLIFILIVVCYICTEFYVSISKKIGSKIKLRKKI